MELAVAVTRGEHGEPDVLDQVPKLGRIDGIGGHGLPFDVGGLTKGSGPSSKLPSLLPWPEVHLERPGRALLPVELPVDLGNVVGIEDRVRAGIVALGKIGPDPFGVDGAVDHDMADMDVLRLERAG